MARAIDQAPITPETAGPALVDLVDAALRSRGALAPADACALLAPLPDAIAAARAAGDRVTVPRTAERETRAVLAALGLATPARPRRGEPVPFRAPELEPDAPPTARSDVYAVAGLLRTAVTGQQPPPWTLQTTPSAAEAQALNGPFGEALWDGLADDPAERPASAQALLDVAAAALAPAPSATPAAAPATDERRVQLLGAAVAGAFFLGLLLAVLGGGGGGADEAEPPDRIALLPAALAPASPAAQAGALYAADMAQTMRRLNVRRVARRERLAEAQTVRGQSRAATSLGEAYGIAARSAGRASPPVSVRATHDGIVDAMRLVESGYRTMARGVRDGDRAQYVRGRDAVRRREALLQRRVQRLDGQGFEVR